LIGRRAFLNQAMGEKSNRINPSIDLSIGRSIENHGVGLRATPHVPDAARKALQETDRSIVQ
jgi:hypothetical protein